MKINFVIIFLNINFSILVIWQYLILQDFHSVQCTPMILFSIIWQELNLSTFGIFGGNFYNFLKKKILFCHEN